MKPKSIIEKGERFEKLIAREIEAEGLGLARRESGSGSGKKKGDIAANLPFLLECKNWDVRIKIILNWIDQAKKQAEIGNWSRDKWALIFKDPRSSEANPEIYGVIDFWQLLKLFKKDSVARIKEPDREMKWKLQKLINSALAASKEVETETGWKIIRMRKDAKAVLKELKN